MPFFHYDMSKSIASAGRMPRFRKRWAQCYIQPRKRGSYADDWLHVKCTGKRAKTKDRTLLSSPAWVRTWWDSISGHFLFLLSLLPQSLSWKQVSESDAPVTNHRIDRCLFPIHQAHGRASEIWREREGIVWTYFRMMIRMFRMTSVGGFMDGWY